MRILENELKLAVPVSIAFKWFKDLDKNYLKWHPKAHRAFVWLSGKPIGEGARFYFEEDINGHHHKILMQVSEYVENVILSFSSVSIQVQSTVLPDRIFSLLCALFKIRLEIERNFKSVSQNSTIIHTTHKFGSHLPLIGTLVEWFINTFIFSHKHHASHMQEEGEYMKRNLEAV